MKIITTVLLFAILSSCSHSNNKIEKIRRIGIHTFSSVSQGGNQVNWYYIRNRDSPGEKGYYLLSEKPLENFANANFVYYDSKPEKLMQSYPLKEKIMLVNANDLPANVQQSIADLESTSVSE
ncbi:MAG: hypothetical protein ABIN25_08830 [Ginsengibacter sp.]